MADGYEASAYWDRGGLALLWSAVLIAPASLALNIGLGYALVKWVCSGGHAAVLFGVWAAALVMSVAGLVLGWRLMGRARNAREDGGSAVDRSYFGAKVAVGLNVLAVLLLVTSGSAQLMVDSCV
jgi:hypothetical protein